MSSIREQESAQGSSIPKERAIWIALFILPLLFYPRALSSSWVSNSDVHSLLEFWAAIAALTTAGIVLIHFFATGRRFFLMISLGLTLQGSEDLVHAIYSFTRIWPAEQAGIASFVPGTYVSGRLMKTDIVFESGGRVTLTTRNRGRGAERWLTHLQRYSQ